MKNYSVLLGETYLISQKMCEVVMQTAELVFRR